MKKDEMKNTMDATPAKSDKTARSSASQKKAVAKKTAVAKTADSVATTATTAVDSMATENINTTTVAATAVDSVATDTVATENNNATDTVATTAADNAVDSVTTENNNATDTVATTATDNAVDSVATDNINATDTAVDSVTTENINATDTVATTATDSVTTENNNATDTVALADNNDNVSTVTNDTHGDSICASGNAADVSNASGNIADSTVNSNASDDNGAPKQKEKRTVKQYLKYAVKRYFIDAFSGMALGLFCTLIIGTIIGQIGSLIGDNATGKIISQVGSVAKLLMGAGIGCGIAFSLKAKKLTSFSTAVAGMVGANITNIFGLSGVAIWGASATPSITIGDPVGAYVAAVFAIEIADLVEGKTPVDILVVPLTAITVGTVAAICLGIPFGMLFALLGKGVAMAITWEKVSFGILVAVIMGILLTLPTSSAAFGVMLFNNNPLITPDLQLGADLAAAAACAGCCAHMVGFAVCSFRENKWGGVVAQGLGTSMLQIPNLAVNPRILIPPVIASAVAGPLASAAFGLTCNATGSGMGTAGLVGVIQTFFVSIENGMAWWLVLIGVLVCYIIVPAAVSLGVSELMRKKNWIKFGDMKLPQ